MGIQTDNDATSGHGMLQTTKKEIRRSKTREDSIARTETVCEGREKKTHSYIFGNIFLSHPLARELWTYG